MSPDPGSVRLTTLADIEAAVEPISRVARVTPVLRPVSLAALAGRPLALKCEHLQRTGSFKIRGASNCIANLEPGTDVVTASAGNHAQGVALAATQRQLHSTVFMPETASLPKVQATRDYGADVVLEGASYEDAAAAAHAHADSTGARYVHAFDDPLVIAGQGTLGLELAEQAPEVATFVIPIGGGGLAGGVAAALKACRPECRVVGVEAAGAPDMQRSLAAGHPVTLERVDTIADGIAVKRVSALTLAHAQAFLDDVVTVDDEEISRALVLLLERAKAVVEPAGAAALAAVLADRVGGAPGSAVAAVVSGGNVDPALLTRLVHHGLEAAGRHLFLRVVLEDRPGALHELLGVIARLGINVVEVDHHRTGISLPVGETEVGLAVETRDRTQQDVARRAIREAGFRVA
ncbi:MAG TPA: threonine ammonia-lyase [Acidimicrobiia bacterium]